MKERMTTLYSLLIETMKNYLNEYPFNKEYVKQSATYVKNFFFKEWRYGQTVSNIVIEIFPYIKISPEYDCFYNDDNVDIFLNKVEILLLEKNI